MIALLDVVDVGSILFLSQQGREEGQVFRE